MTTRRTLSKAERQSILDRHNSRCGRCTRHVATYERWKADHVIPLVEGGADEPENMQPLCPQCDYEKTSGEARGRGKVRRIQAQNDEYAQYGRKLNARERKLVRMGKDIE